MKSYAPRGSALENPTLSLETGGPNFPIMENQMEKNMENEMETLGPFKGRIKWKRT